MNTEQERAEFEAFLRSIDGASVKHTREGDYYEDWADTRAWRAWQARAALQSQDREDAERLQAMAAEWDRARRGGDSSMPIWFALCDAIGSDADGAGMRAAIDHARRIEGEGE